MSAARRYELVYVVSRKRPTSRWRRSARRRSRQIVAALGGTIEKTENWGRRKLAYEIGHHKEGIYVLEVINGGGELMKELDRRLKVIDRSSATSIVRVDEDHRWPSGRARAARKTQRRRRVARGLPPERQPKAKAPRRQRRRRRGDDRHRGGDLAMACQEDEWRGGGGRGRAAGRRRGGRRRRQGRRPAARRCSAGGRSASSARTRSTTSTTRT